MKTIVKKKYIHIKPTPKKDIEDGLKVELFKPMSNNTEPFATTDIKKGEGKYSKPNKGTVDKPDYNTVKKAWINN